MSVTTSTEGPTIEYTVRTRAKAAASGFYYYVWSIDHSRQDASTRPFVTEGWSFQDRFGLGSEQSIVPMRVTATTQVPTPAVALGGVPADTYWLEGHDGQTVAVVPSRQLVVVRLGLTPAKYGYRPQKMLAELVKVLN